MTKLIIYIVVFAIIYVLLDLTSISYGQVTEPIVIQSGPVAAHGYSPFYTHQTGELAPMVESPVLPHYSLHGLVGGTTWCYGFKWPRKHCDAQCMAPTKKKLAEQLETHCREQENTKQCLEEGIPFTEENYDMVISMAAAHTVVQDFATRVAWDGLSFGEFSKQHAPIFAGLQGRQFAILDCHSNGAMLCLAALRNPDVMKRTTAKKVRLFGPQINPQAAERWQEWMRNNQGSTVEIYINNGDPVPSVTWMLPNPQTDLGAVATLTWFVTNPINVVVFSDALMAAWRDSKYATLDKKLETYGFKVTRFYKSPNDPAGLKYGIPGIEFHSMLCTLAI